jgi:membrane-associated protein
VIESLLEFILHIDRHLDVIVARYGGWTYALTFAIIFAETGFVFTPFLPGDSLLFAVGAIAARGSLSVVALVILLAAAAIAGDTVNYWIGTALGPRLFRGERSRWLNRRHLDRTHSFYEKYGNMTIVLARFVPIVRTFAPFVAGIARMTYWRFLIYNVVGGILWVLLFVLGGYFFGNLSVVKENFSLVLLGIILVSLIPPLIEFLRVKASSGDPKRHAGRPPTG